MSFRLVAALIEHVSVRAVIALTLCATVGTSSLAYDQLNLTRVYTRGELAEYQNGQLIDLILARQEAFGIPSSVPAPSEHHVGRTLAIIGGAIGAAGLVLLANSMRAHARFDSETQHTSFASVTRRTALQASTVCNPETSLFCTGNVTQTACNEWSVFSSASQSALTIYAGTSASANTESSPSVLGTPTVDRTLNVVTETVIVPHAVATEVPKAGGGTESGFTGSLPTSQRGGGTTATYLGAAANFVLGSGNILLGCNNQNNLGTSSSASGSPSASLLHR